MRETLPWGGHHIFDRLVARRLQRFYERFLERLPDAQDVLDVGCGPGHLAAALSERADVLGIDLDPVQIKIARRAHPDVRFQEGASHALPVPDASQDWVLATESFHHWSRPHESAVEIHRVLRPGGQWWIVEGAADMTKDEFTAWTGRRPFPGLMAWVRMVFTQHGYSHTALEQDVLPVVAPHFHVEVEREDGWWIVRCTKPPA